MNEQLAIRRLLHNNPAFAAQLREMVADGKLQSADQLSEDGPLMIVGAHDHYGINGSQRFDCSCGKHFWLSPSAVALAERHKGPVQRVCVACAVDLTGAK